MKNLKLYYIDEEYINYLRQFDSNVAYNKTSTRPYIGVVYTYNNLNYFQNMFRKGHLSDNILKRCCNFILLEAKFEEYLSQK